MNIYIVAFWVKILCILECWHQCFRGTFYSHLEGYSLALVPQIPWFLPIQTTHHHNPEDCSMNCIKCVTVYISIPGDNMNNYNLKTNN
jgi:hypothetical protein